MPFDKETARTPLRRDISFLVVQVLDPGKADWIKEPTQLHAGSTSSTWVHTQLWRRPRVVTGEPRKSSLFIRHPTSPGPVPRRNACKRLAA